MKWDVSEFMNISLYNICNYIDEVIECVKKEDKGIFFIFQNFLIYFQENLLIINLL